MKTIKEQIQTIPDFPKPGIMFRDITPLLYHADAFKRTIDLLEEHYKDEKIDVIVGAEARGFFFGPPLAMRFGIGFVPVRKPNKLPGETHSVEYELEYGVDCLEIHHDAIPEGSRVLVIDDLLATGGTVEACIRLIEKVGSEVMGCAFVIELTDLKGRARLKAPSFSLVEFEGE